MRFHGHSIVITLILLALVPVGTAGAQTCLTDAEKAELHDVVRVIWNAFGSSTPTPAGPPPARILDVFGVGPGQASYRDLSVEDMMAFLQGLIRTERVKKRCLPGQGAATYMVRTRIELHEPTVNALASADPMTRAKARLQLMISLSNEAVHCMQYLPVSNAQACDMERDSDLFSELFLNRIIEAMTDQSGTPLTTLAAVDADPQGIERLTRLLPAGASAADIAAFVNCARLERDFIHDRRVYFFEAAAADPNVEWTDYYRGGGGDASPRRPRADLSADRKTLTITAPDGTTTSYTVPAFESITQISAHLDDVGRTVLVIASVSQFNDHVLRFYVDTDGDGIPETTVANTTYLNSAAADPGLGGALVDRYKSDVAGGPVLIYREDVGGGIEVVPLGPDGLPAGAAQSVGAVLPGTAPFFGGVVAVGPGIDRLVFSGVPSDSERSADPVAIVDWNGTTASTSTGTRAQAEGAGSIPPMVVEGRFDPRDVSLLVPQPGQWPIRLVGDVGAAVGMSHHDAQGTVQVDAAGVVGTDGVTSLKSVVLLPDTLYHVSDGVSTREFFVPAAGLPLDHVELDEGGDGTVERVQITTGPARIKLLEGPVGSDERIMYDELVPAHPVPTNFDGTWSPISRSLVTDAGVRQAIPVPGRRYADAVDDLDGDGIAAEGVVLSRTPGNDFTLEIWGNLLVAPTLLQQTPLGLGADPEYYVYHDSLAGGRDVCVPMTDGTSLSLVRSPSGLWLLTTALYPGTGDDFRVEVSVNGAVSPCGVSTPSGGDLLGVTLDSTVTTFDHSPILLVAQLFATGTPPTPLPAWGIRFDPLATPAPLALVNGTAQTPLGPAATLLPQGNPYAYLLPSALPPTTSVMLQGLVLDPFAQNGFFAATDAHELRF